MSPIDDKIKHTNHRKYIEDCNKTCKTYNYKRESQKPRYRLTLPYQDSISIRI